MIYLFILLRLLDLLTTYIGIQLGVSEGNLLQAILMQVGIFYYPLNLALSMGVYLVLSRFRIGRLILKGFIILNILVILVNIFCIGLALYINL